MAAKVTNINRVVDPRADTLLMLSVCNEQQRAEKNLD